MAEYPYFPLFIDLSEKKLVIFGAGRIARRRITVLSQFTPALTVIAPDCLPEVEELAAESKMSEKAIREAVRFSGNNIEYIEDEE
jgi:siroheme synthase (precorrin-2 oxidase/ferrochelatase)